MDRRSADHTAPVCRRSQPGQPNVAQIGCDIEIANYKHAIQSAFRDVADALVQRSKYTAQLSAQVTLVDATRISRELAKARFNIGADSYLNVLDAERSLYCAQQTLIITRLEQASTVVTLYRALGGGLREHEAATSDSLEIQSQSEQTEPRSVHTVF